MFVLARGQAIALGHSWLGCEHLLLGILELGRGAAFEALTHTGVSYDAARHHLTDLGGVNPVSPISDEDALASLGIDLPQVRERLAATFGPDALTGATETPLFTPETKRAIKLAVRRARALDKAPPSVEHLFLGILAEGSNGGTCLLDGLAVDRCRLARRVNELAFSGARHRREGRAGMLRMIEGCTHAARRVGYVGGAVLILLSVIAAAAGTNMVRARYSHDTCTESRPLAAGASTPVTVKVGFVYRDTVALGEVDVNGGLYSADLPEEFSHWPWSGTDPKWQSRAPLTEYDAVVENRAAVPQSHVNLLLISPGDRPRPLHLFASCGDSDVQSTSLPN